ncbi:hypothetical protein [Streptomyces sp. NPDC037389]|uniref:helix-turn-helix transcriptional regulator n=1 Tax=Streptomyces sp. NPDC037389 TaxID=3155369 RepID=UPI0033EE5A88
MDEPLVYLAQIARITGVGRAAVKNWRHQYDDFPDAVGGTDESPLFRHSEVMAWLRTHDKIFEPGPPKPPATLTLVGGQTVTVLGPNLFSSSYGEVVFEELGGFVEHDALIPWPRVDVARAEVPGHPPFMVDRADVDISYGASPTVKFLQLLWRTEQRRPLPIPPADGPTHTEEAQR